ncbi:MAG: branched-chain amino acid transporter [Gammaproteobacteria bacterium]|nr:branched-chain amino acid transporter [Gammaproteobacteria bacterium]
MNELGYLWSVILIMGLVTFAIRLLPFLLLHRHADHPLLDYLGRYTPPAIMTLLVIYSLKDVAFAQLSSGGPVVVALFTTIAVHLWRSNALLSIAAGTGCYMLLLRLG